MDLRFFSSPHRRNRRQRLLSGMARLSPASGSAVLGWLGVLGWLALGGPAQAAAHAALAASSAPAALNPAALPIGFPASAPADTLSWDDIPWVGVEQALDAGVLSTRRILIYVHAPWCPYCRRMNTELLNDPDVQSAIKAYFSPVRINTESQDSVRYFEYGMTEREFAGALRNESLPTLYFMSPEGEVFAHQPGLLPREDLLKLLHYVGSGAFEEIPFESYSPPDAP